MLKNISLDMWKVIPSKTVANALRAGASRKDMPEVDLVGCLHNQIRHLTCPTSSASFTPPPIIIRHTVGGLRSTMSELALSDLDSIYMDSDVLRGQTLG
jgi:hypothetical protein